MPSFQHSIAVSPFRCAVPLYRWRSVATVAVARENGIAVNVFPYTYRDGVNRTLIGCPPAAERQK